MRNFFSRLAEVFQGKPRKGASPPSRTSTEYGFLVFQHTGEVIRAERILREAGFAVEVKGPPPELRTGCDMIIVFDLMQEPLIRNALGAARLEPIQSVPMRDTLLEPVSLFHVQDYGDWFMVRAANMKITVERATGKIVNVSGGGCPDVPYLAALLTELYEKKSLTKAALARQAGMSEVYLHQVFAGRRNPSRDRLLCLCIGLEATLEETQELLKQCGFAQLYPKDRRDAIILYGILNGMDLFGVNDKLFAENEETLY